MLLEKAAIDKPQKLKQKFFGEDVFVKMPTELKRCRRAAMMFDAKGNHKDSYRERHRIYTIIDSVCDKSGKPLFTDADANSLAELDSMKLDALHSAIQEWVDSKEKNEGAGSQS